MELDSKRWTTSIAKHTQSVLSRCFFSMQFPNVNYFGQQWGKGDFLSRLQQIPLSPPFSKGEVWKSYSTNFSSRTLEKNAQIRRRQDRLIQEDGSSGDLPLAVDFPQHIVPSAYEQILTVLELRPVNQKVRPNPHLELLVTRLHLHVHYEVAGTRRWHFCPRQACGKSCDTGVQCLLGFFKQRKVPGLGDSIRRVSHVQRIVPVRHPVHDVIGKKIQPFME